MKRLLIAVLLAVSGFAAVSTVAAAPAGATTLTRHGIWFSLPNHAKAWNGGSTRWIRAKSHVVSGVHKVITGRLLKVWENGDYKGSGAPLKLGPGDYELAQVIRYRTYRLGTHKVRVWRPRDMPNHSVCKVKAVDSDGFITRGDCTNSRYPGQHVTDHEGLANGRYYPWKVGQTYIDDVVTFKGQYVHVERYGRIYTGRATYKTNRFPITVKAAWHWCGAPHNPWHYNYCGSGPLVWSAASAVCSYFSCIDNFWNGSGYMVECADGTVSMSGGISGACSYHGGEWRAVRRG